MFLFCLIKGVISFNQQNVDLITEVNSNNYDSTNIGNNNVDILRNVDFKDPKNYSCQAQNNFGLVVFNLSIVLKGK